MWRVWLHLLLSILQLNVSHTDISSTTAALFFPFYIQKRWKMGSMDSCGLEIHLNVVIWIDLTWLVFKAGQCFTNTKEILYSHRSRLLFLKSWWHTRHAASTQSASCFVFIVFKRRSGLCCDVAVQSRPERSRKNGCNKVCLALPERQKVEPVWARIMICFVALFSFSFSNARYLWTLQNRVSG